MSRSDHKSPTNNAANDENNQGIPHDSSLNHLHCFLCKCSDPNYLVYSPKDDFYLCTNGPEKLKGSHLLFVLERYGSVPLQKVIYSKTILPIPNDDDEDNENESINSETDFSIIDSEKNQKIKYILHKEKYIPIQCKKCQNPNIFDLGFFKQEKKKKSKSDDESSNIDENGNLENIENIQKSFDNLICIQCLLKEYGSKSKIIRSFNPLISLYTITDLIANRSTDKSMISRWLLPEDQFRQQILTLRKLRNFNIKSIDKIDLKPLKLHYKHPGNYVNALLPFINEEENVSNNKTLSEKFFGIKIEVMIDKIKGKNQKTYNESDLKTKVHKSFYEFSFLARHSIFASMVPGSRVSIRLSNSKNAGNDDNNEDDRILGIVLNRDPKTSYVTITITSGYIKAPEDPKFCERSIRVPKDEDDKQDKDDTKYDIFTIYSFIENVDIFRRPTSIPFTRQRDTLTKFMQFMKSKKYDFFIKIMSGNLKYVNTLINGKVEPFVKNVDKENVIKRKNEEEEEEDKNDEEEENKNEEEEDNDYDENEDDKIGNDSLEDDQLEQITNKLIESLYANCQLKQNDDQYKAIKFALMHKFAMIQGPPGTGKSTCIALQALLYYIQDQGVLIITHSNAASDHITEIILRLIDTISKNPNSSRKIPSDAVVRVCGSTYEVIAQGNKNLKPVLSSTFVSNRLRYRNDNKENHYQQKEFIKENSNKIYIATAITSGGSRLDRIFKNVIVDESNQLVDTELLVPLSHKCEHLTLYGDHKQIGPFVYSNNCKKNNFALSFIERLPKLGYEPICLETQYRMHPEISEFPSKAFYEGRLKNGVTANDRIFEADKDLLMQKDIPIVFYNVKNSIEQFSSSGKSFLNVAEASTLGEIISKFKKSVPAIQPEQIAIITFYNGMIDILRSHLRYLSSSNNNNSDQKDESFYDNLRIDTVDAFEGSDIDYVILICVRSNKKKNIGFLSDMGRLNVALTRAKKGFFIIGNKKNFANDETWSNLINSLSIREVVCDV